MAERPDDRARDALDELLDRRLRAELRADLGPDEDANGALQALTPAFARAARVRRAQMVLSSAAVLLAVAGGAVVANSFLSEGAEQIEAADGAGGTDADRLEVDGHLTTIEVELADDPDPATVDADGASGQAGVGEAVSDRVATSTTGGAGSTDGAGATTPPSTAPDPPTSSTTRPPTTPGPTAETSAPSPSMPPTETSLAADERLVESRCGDLVVRVAGTSIQLVEAVPDPGYSADIETSGLSEVKVAFTGRHECEVWARFEDGRFTTSSEHDEHHD